MSSSSAAQPEGMQHISVEGTAAAAVAIDSAKIFTTNNITGHGNLRPLGIVRGMTVRSRSIGANIGAGFKAMAGGEIKTFTTLCEQARKEALSRMLEHAAECGATGVICIRYDTNLISAGVTEVLAYGMAVTDVAATPSDAPSQDAAPGGILSGYICSSNEIPGMTVQKSLGVVNGITVRSRSIGMALGAIGKTLVGGEIRNWTKLCDDARQEAYTRMLAEAVSRGADGVVGMRYSTNEIRDGITEVIAYGTAVKSAASNSASDNLPIPATGVQMEMVTTSNSLPGLDAAHAYGMVKGISVRSANLLRSIGASFKSLAGGEIRNWTDMCVEARSLAFERMIAEANRIGAKGIVAMRYDATQVTENSIVEVIAYGTAVSDQPLVEEVATTELPQSMVTTDLQLPGKVFNRNLGIVRGISVKSQNIFLDIGAGFKSIVGGEINNFLALCESARQAAHGNMMKHAYEMGATGVTCMRFESNDLAPGVIEVVAYGTAVTDGSRSPAEGYQCEQLGAIDSACLSTTNEVIGQSFDQSLGVVRGITCRSRNFFASFGAGMKAGFVGGEINAWNNLCEQARIESTKRLIEEAAAVGAKGIVAVRYETNEIAPGIQETIAFGTAVA